MSDWEKYNHAVIIHFYYGLDELDAVHEFEKRLTLIIENNRLGFYDGHELAMDNSDGFLYMYGKNAETLFKAILPALKAHPLMQGAAAHLEFGDIEDNPKCIDVNLDDL
ncbi:MAG: hypothetical protein ACQES1_03275 [Bacteroidota bacterium]